MSSGRDLRIRLLCLQAETERFGLELAVRELQDSLVGVTSFVAALRGGADGDARGSVLGRGRQVLRVARNYPLVTTAILAGFKALWHRPFIALGAGLVAAAGWWLARPLGQSPPAA
jgi:hypothetical protein